MLISGKLEALATLNQNYEILLVKILEEKWLLVTAFLYNMK
jgi:hypothetical protein